MNGRHPLLAALAQARLDKGLTQKQLADRLLIHPRAVSHRETGHATHGLIEIDRHARALGYRLALIPLKGNQ